MSRKPRPLRSVWRDVVAKSDLDPAARPVAFLLALYMDRAGVCWPSLGKLAEALGRQRDTVRRHVLMVEEAGLLAVERSAGGPSDATNVYAARCPDSAPAKLRAEFATPLTHEGGSAGDPPHQRRRPPSPATLTPLTREGRSTKKYQEAGDNAAASLSGFASSSPEKNWPGGECQGCHREEVALVDEDSLYCRECFAIREMLPVGEGAT